MKDRENLYLKEIDELVFREINFAKLKNVL